MRSFYRHYTDGIGIYRVRNGKRPSADPNGKLWNMSFLDKRKWVSLNWHLTWSDLKKFIYLGCTAYSVSTLSVERRTVNYGFAEMAEKLWSAIAKPN